VVGWYLKLGGSQSWVANAPCNYAGEEEEEKIEKPRRERGKHLRQRRHKRRDPSRVGILF